MMQINPKEVDVEILAILCDAIVRNLPDAKGLPASYLRKPLEALFSRMVSKLTSNAELWRIMGKFYVSIGQQSKVSSCSSIEVSSPILRVDFL